MKMTGADATRANPILTAETYVESIADYLPQALVKPEALIAIRGIAHRLPPFPTLGFEAHLGSGPPRADFAVCIRASDFCRTDPECLWTSEADQGGDSLAWSKLGDLTRRWFNTKSPLYSGVYNVWLEFDVHFPVKAVPNLLLGLRGGSQALTVAYSAMELLVGDLAASITWPTVERCFAAVPSGGHVFQMGVWLSRSLDGFRICVHGIPIKQVPRYLEAIGWPGDRARLEEMLVSLDRITHSVAIDLDLVGDVLPRVGIECFPVEVKRPAFDIRWKTLLDALVADDLCTDTQEEALLSWPGCNQRRLIWPVLFVRGLNHVKVVLEADGALNAKAYFGFVQIQCATPTNTVFTEPLFGCGESHDAP